jgi:hypothetical protein
LLKVPQRPGHLAAPAYFAGLALAFFAQSSQQTVISLPPTFTWIPPSLISQSHTGHFFVFMAYLHGFELIIRVVAIVLRNAHEDRVARQEKSNFQILAHFAKRSAAGVAAYAGGRAAELTSEGVGEVAVAGKPQFESECSQILRAIG